MRRTLFARSGIAMLMAVSACSNNPGSSPVADTPAPAVQPAGDDTQATIERLEREWVGAIVKNDAATLNRLLADDFVGTSPTAHTYDKPAAVSDLQSGTYVVKAMNLDEVSANVYGDTAVAFTSQEESSTYGGKDTSGHYHYTNVWNRANGEWRVVASHGSRYAQSH